MDFSTPAHKQKQLLKNGRTDTPASSDELPQAKKKEFMALKIRGVHGLKDKRDAFLKEL